MPGWVTEVKQQVAEKAALGLIQGRQPQSINEWNVYLALVRLHFEFTYQYPIDGGHALRGGQVLDFVLWSAPRPIALYIQGAYWHKGLMTTEDQLKQARVQKMGFEVVDLEEAETETPELAYAAIRKKAGYG